MQRLASKALTGTAIALVILPSFSAAPRPHSVTPSLPSQGTPVNLPQRRGPAKTSAVVDRFKKLGLDELKEQALREISTLARNAYCVKDATQTFALERYTVHSQMTPLLRDIAGAHTAAAAGRLSEAERLRIEEEVSGWEKRRDKTWFDYTARVADCFNREKNLPPSEKLAKTAEKIRRSLVEPPSFKSTRKVHDYSSPWDSDGSSVSQPDGGIKGYDQLDQKLRDPSIPQSG